jgi:hypothetical protein
MLTPTGGEFWQSRVRDVNLKILPALCFRPDPFAWTESSSPRTTSR